MIQGKEAVKTVGSSLTTGRVVLANDAIVPHRTESQDNDVPFTGCGCYSTTEIHPNSSTRSPPYESFENFSDSLLVSLTVCVHVSVSSLRPWASFHCDYSSIVRNLAVFCRPDAQRDDVHCWVLVWPSFCCCPVKNPPLADPVAVDQYRLLPQPRGSDHLTETPDACDFP